MTKSRYVTNHHLIPKSVWDVDLSETRKSNNYCTNCSRAFFDCENTSLQIL